jgi:hypothetical protein
MWVPAAAEFELQRASRHHFDEGIHMIANARLDLPRRSPAAVDLRWARGVWTGLEAFGARRARAELLRVAQQREASDPQLAAQLRQVVKEDWLTQG